MGSPRYLEPAAREDLAEKMLFIGGPRQVGKTTLAALMQFGGFPEPFLKASTRTLRRWQNERFERFFREDVRDLESVRDLGSLQMLADLLPERVGSPLSLNALRENLEVSHRALTHWIEVFERLYYVFRIRPHASREVRSLQKMSKAYTRLCPGRCPGASCRAIPWGTGMNGQECSPLCRDAGAAAARRPGD